MGASQSQSKANANQRRHSLNDGRSTRSRLAGLSLGRRGGSAARSKHGDPAGRGGAHGSYYVSAAAAATASQQAQQANGAVLGRKADGNSSRFGYATGRHELLAGERSANKSAPTYAQAASAAFGCELASGGGARYRQALELAGSLEQPRRSVAMAPAGPLAFGRVQRKASHGGSADRPTRGQPIDFHQAAVPMQPSSSAKQQQQYRRSSSLASQPARRESAGRLLALFKPAQEQQQVSEAERACVGSLKRARPNAQQATYEAMRTIDMYLVRQIARSCKDYEMEQKIELEIRLRELAAQSMLEAQTEIDLLEVEKSLLASDQRMNCYASELEHLRKQLSNPSLSTDSGRGSKSNHRRSDVVGAAPVGSGATASQGAQGVADLASNSASSPSFSSMSPSKLSPVSGESANSPTSVASSHHSRGYGLSNTGALKLNSVMSAKQKAKLRRRQQLMQSISSLSNINCNMVADNRASVSISELRIPLIWRDVDHFKGKGDYKRFAVFCLLKIDSQIYDTQLITDVDREITDVTFDEIIMFNGIEPNFELNLEVYSCIYVEQFSFSSTPRKLKEKLTSSVSRAMGRRMATASSNYTKELQAYDKSYRFSMIASATFRLEDAADGVRTYDLILVNSTGLGSQQTAHGVRNSISSSSYYNTLGTHTGSDSTSHPYSLSQVYSTSGSTATSREASKNVLPLFGHLCCRLHVRPDVFDKCIRTGYLRMATINLGPGHTSDCTLASSGRGSESPLSSAGSGGGRGSGDGINDFGGSTESTAAKVKSALAASTKMATMSMSSSNLYWAILRNFTLYLWLVDEYKLEAALLRGEQPQLDTSYKPRYTFRIDKSTRLLRVSNSNLTLETNNCCLVLSAHGGFNMDRSHEIGSWLRAIEQHIYDSHIWGSILNHDQRQQQQQHQHHHHRQQQQQCSNHDRTSSRLI